MFFYDHKIYCYNSLLQEQGYIGGYGTTNTTWRYNYGFAVRGSDLYVADYYGHCILKLDISSCAGTHLSTFGQSDNRMNIAKRVIKKNSIKFRLNFWCKFWFDGMGKL